MARIVWTEEAKEDLRVVVARIAEYSHAVSRKWAMKIRKTVNLLQIQPEMGSPIEEDSTSVYREMFVGPYRILYRVQKSTCRIVGILHSKQDYRKRYEGEL